MLSCLMVLVKFLSYLTEENILTEDAFDKMDATGWKGDVQFRPYTAHGPLIDECPVRAVTLFELPELVEMARFEIGFKMGFRSRS